MQNCKNKKSNGKTICWKKEKTKLKRDKLKEVKKLKRLKKKKKT